jgi:hypothetical protein
MLLSLLVTPLIFCSASAQIGQVMATPGSTQAQFFLPFSLVVPSGVTGPITGTITDKGSGMFGGTTSLTVGYVGGFAPSITPNGGSIISSDTVGIGATLSAGQKIYYTITPGNAGVMPTFSNSIYSAPFIVSPIGYIYGGCGGV